MEPIMSKPKYVARKIDNLKDMLEQTTALHSDKEAFVKKAKDVYVGVTYKKYKDDVFSLGTELLKYNIKNEKVILLSENRYEWCVSFMATTCAEGIIVPLSVELDEKEIIEKINEVGAKFIIFSEKYRDMIKNIKRQCSTLEYSIDMDTIIDDADNMSLLRLIDVGAKSLINGDNEFAKFEVNSDAIAGIFYGNTIIKNKAVVLTHKNIVASIMGITSSFPIDENDKVCVFLHLSDVIQCVCNFLTISNQGATISFNEANKEIHELLRENNPTIAFLNKDLIQKLYDNIWLDLGPMPNIRKIRMLMFLSTILIKFNIDLREKIFKDILKRMGKNLRLIVSTERIAKNKMLKDFSTFGINSIQCYGIPEATSVIMINDKTEFIKNNIMGLPVPGLKACISSHNDRASGEITLKGESVMVGYYNDKKATKQVIKDGVLYTGKTGYRDKKGYFYYGKSRKY